MFLILSVYLATATVHSTVTATGGDGNTYMYSQTTVNGNTTTVESNSPGTIHVEKTDSGETITSDNPVTVTHSTDTGKPPTPTVIVREETRIATKTAQLPKNHPNVMALLRNLWDRAISKLLGDLLTRK